MSGPRTQLRELVATDIKQHRPCDADKADAIVDRLLRMPQMQSDESVIAFIDIYRNIVEQRRETRQ